MADFNKTILIGRLTQAPELRFTPQGSPVTTLRVASSRRFRTKGGEEREETLFIDAEVWGTQAENCAQYLVKGQRVLVDGELTMRDWEGKDGQKRRTYEIRAQRVVFMEKPRGAPEAAPGGKESPPEPAAVGTGTSSDEEEEIPF